MATKKKTADAAPAKAQAPTKKKAADAAPAKAPAPAPTESSPPKPKASIEVDWGKGFVLHNDAAVTGSTIKVPVPLRVRQTLGQSQTKGRYDRVKVKRDGQELRVSERRYYQKGNSDGQATLTFEVVE